LRALHSCGLCWQRCAKAASRRVGASSGAAASRPCCCRYTAACVCKRRLYTRSVVIIYWRAVAVVGREGRGVLECPSSQVAWFAENIGRIGVCANLYAFKRCKNRIGCISGCGCATLPGPARPPPFFARTKIDTITNSKDQNERGPALFPSLNRLGLPSLSRKSFHCCLAYSRRSPSQSNIPPGHLFSAALSRRSRYSWGVDVADGGVTLVLARLLSRLCSPVGFCLREHHQLELRG